MIEESESFSNFDKNRKTWFEEEDSVLTKLVKKYGIKRWTEISKAMGEVYDLPEKSGKQCRERWVNHLDPMINKQKWTVEEEKIIFETHKRFGNKWKQISQFLNNRTDNSIKNHFYSILRKGLRRINKMLGDRKSTEKVRNIRTSVLSKLWKIETEGSENKTLKQQNIYQLLFEFSMMKSGDISEKNLSFDVKEHFQDTILHLVSLSGEEKKIKEKRAHENKEKKNRSCSFSFEMIEEAESEQCSDQEDDQFSFDRRGSKLLGNFESPDKPANKSLDIDRLFGSLRGSQIEKSRVDSDLAQSQKPRKNQKSVVVIQNDKKSPMVPEKNQEEFYIPNITISLEDQSLNMSGSQPKDCGDCHFFAFNMSPRYPTSVFDQILAKTPRINSPGAFNIYSGTTKFQSKDLYESNGDFQFKQILEGLKSDINANSINGNCGSQYRIYSSRNSIIEGGLRLSGSSGCLTPQSSSGR